MTEFVDQQSRKKAPAQTDPMKQHVIQPHRLRQIGLSCHQHRTAITKYRGDLGGRLAVTRKAPHHITTDIYVSTTFKIGHDEMLRN
jgi:hypothetical protein